MRLLGINHSLPVSVHQKGYLVSAFLVESQSVHMHTLKLAVIKLDEVLGQDGGPTFGIEQLRTVIQSRLHKLDPFGYELIDIPFKFHHPMWRENAEVDLEYHVRPYRVDLPGGRRQLDWRRPPTRLAAAS